MEAQVDKIIVGMSKDDWDAQGQYSHALNVNIEGEDGKQYVLQNEPSNILGAEIKPGFKVIGRGRDYSTNDLYLILTNPDTGDGEIGKIELIQRNDNEVLDETLCGDCGSLSLGDRLEKIDQVAYMRYQTIISDECHIDPKQKFGFDVNYPIKNIVFKREGSTLKMYFTDAKTPRNIDITNIDKYYTVEVPCGDNTTITCPDLETTKIFRDAYPPTIELEGVMKGGRLPESVYEYFIKYCDQDGENITEVLDRTEQIKIFDTGRVVRDLGKTLTTDTAIKLRVENLDKRYTHYKVIVKQQEPSTREDGGYTARTYLLGVFNIERKTITHMDSNNLVEVSEGTELRTGRRYVESTDVVESANNLLIHTGIKEKRTLNLQPVVNLIGEFAKWRTYAVVDEFYEGQDASSTKVGYQRDEVEPLGIRFRTASGMVTSVMPLIGRTPEPTDLEEVANNLDMESLNNSQKTCETAGQRKERWQLYNTASVDPIGIACIEPEDENETYIETEETLERVCEVDEVATIENGQLEVYLEDEEDYDGFVGFLEDNVLNTNTRTCTRLITGRDAERFCNMLNTDYPISTDCDTDELFEGMEYRVINTMKSNTLSNVGEYTEELIPALFPEEYSRSVVNNQLTPMQRGINTGDRQFEDVAVVAQIGVFYQFIYKSAKAPWTNWRIFPAVVTRGTEDQYTECSGAEEIMKERNVGSQNKKVMNNIFKYHFPNINGELSELALEREMWTNKVHDLPEVVHGATDEVMVLMYGVTDEGQENASAEAWEYRDAIWDSSLQATITVDGKTYTSGNSHIPGAIDNIMGNLDKVLPEHTNYVRDWEHWAGEGSYKGPLPEEVSITNVGNSSVHIGFYGQDEIRPNRVSNNASWAKITPQLNIDEESFIVDVSPNGNTYMNERNDFFNNIHYQKKLGSRVIISVFTDCSSDKAVYSIETDYSESHILKFTRTGDYDLTIEDGRGNIKNIEGGFRQGGYHICVDTLTLKVAKNGNELGGYISFPSMGYYSITWRNIRHSKSKVDFNKISVGQSVNFIALCKFRQPVLNSCNMVPKKTGNFAYWQSTEIYPDNDYLYDSRNLKVKESLIPPNIKDKFVSKFTTGEVTDGAYTTNLDLRCEPIRHFKFPNNSIAPIMGTTPVQPFGDTIMEVIGVSINEEVINMALDVAVDNGLITDVERASIVEYEILRGDMTLERTVQSSGLLFDLREYDEGMHKVSYPNYPYNSFGPDIFNNIRPEGSFGKEGSKFTFHSPETDYYGITSGTELSVQGVQLGNSKGNFEEVKDHPKWIVMTDKAFRQARRLARLEVDLEMTLTSLQMLSNGVTGFFAGLTSGAFVPVQAIAAVAGLAATVIMREPKIERYKIEWLRNYENLGIPINFAYYYHSIGKYTYMMTLNQAGESLRSLDINKVMGSGSYTVVNPLTGKRTTVNNKYREQTTYLDVGEYPISYNDRYTTFDNGASSSIFNLTKSSYREGKNKSVEATRNIASMYVYLKDYIPNQHSTINNINWVSTGFKRALNEPLQCTRIFGGDTYLVRHSLKRKMAQFDVDYQRQADMTPIDYKFYNNIGKDPRFYAKFKTDASPEDISGKEVSEYEYTVSFDNETKSGKYYVADSKIYLYYYGVPYFICESRINTNFREAGKAYVDQYYPAIEDISEWTQQKNVDIQEPNTYYYNRPLYSRSEATIGAMTIPEDYDPNLDRNQVYKQGMIMYSDPDKDIFGKSDPWLIYKPNNVYFSNNDWGKLQGVVGVENEAILGLYDLKSVLFNAVDTTIDTGINPEARNFGDGVLFSRRVKDFATSLGGFGGTQGYQTIATEYGQFIVNNSAGEIYQIYGGQIVPISERNSSGASTSMSSWFKAHLPYKIKGSSIDNANNIDVDNAFNGVGMTLGYDNRFKRLFVTKKDYLPKVQGITYVDKQGFFLEGNKVEVSDPQYFEDVGFTVAYSLKMQKWMSFYSFKPNYYVTDRNAFYTGKNDEGKVKGLWTHNKTNKSYQVYYGDFHPFEVDFRVGNLRGFNNQVHDINFNLVTYKYHNNFDKADILSMFNKAYIYSEGINSGELRLVMSNGTLDQAIEYPKTSRDKKFQEIIVTPLAENNYSINHIFNRTNPKIVNVPIWFNGNDGYSKELNFNKTNFSPIVEDLRPFRAHKPNIRLIQDKESRLNYNLDLVVTRTLSVKE